MEDTAAPTPTSPILTAPWLTNVLQNAGVISSNVTVCAVCVLINRLKGGIGGGPVVPYDITYVHKCESHETDNASSDYTIHGLPITIIVKAPVEGTVTKVAREAWFLSEMLPVSPLHLRTMLLLLLL